MKYISPKAHNDILNIFEFMSTDDLTAAKKRNRYYISFNRKSNDISRNGI